MAVHQEWGIISLENSLLKSFNTNEHPCNFIQNNSTLFRCFTLLVAFAYEQFSFLFTLKKEEFINRATLNLSARWNRKFVHYRVFTRGFQTVRCFHCSSSNCCRTHLMMSNPWAWRRSFFVHNYKSMKFKSMIWSYLFRRLCVDSVFELFPSHYKIPSWTKKAEILLFRVSGFFPSKRTLNNFMGRRFNVDV